MHINSGKSKFLSQEAAAGLSAGFHTGLSLHVDDRALDDQMTLYHEQIHGRIFSETSDGLLHSYMKLAATEAAYITMNKEITLFSNYLFSETRIAHERVATYLGVQSFPDEKKIPETRNNLSPGYKEYYSFFEKILGNIQSSHLRYLVCWGIGMVAFSSPRIFLFNSRKLPELDELRKIPGPSERLDTVANYILTQGTNGLISDIELVVQQSATEVCFNGFDPFVEANWALAARDDLTQLQDIENVILKHYRKLTADAAGLELCLNIELPEYFKPLSDRVAFRYEPVRVIDKKLIFSLEDAQHSAHQADQTRIRREHIPQVWTYIGSDTLSWVQKNIKNDIWIAAVEIPDRLNNFKIFLSAKTLTSRKYFERTPFTVTADEFYTLLTQMQFNFCVSNENLPLVICFYHLLKHGRETQGGSLHFPVPSRAKVIYFRPDTRLSKGSQFGFIPIAYTRERWADVIRQSIGEHIWYQAKLSVPQVGAQYNIGIEYIFPKQANLMPYMCIMPAAIQHYYVPLLRHKEDTRELYSTNMKINESLLDASLYSLWDALRDL